MNNTNEPVGTSKGLSTLERPRFGPGMLLHHEDLEQLNIYTRSLSRLLFQSFFGCGVICGLVIEEVVEECEKLKITIQPGVALSCAGDPVYVPVAKDVFTKEGLELDVNLKLWVVLCGTTKCCAPRTTTCSCDDDETTSDCTREKDAFEIRLMLERPKCACACPLPEEGDEPEPEMDPAAVDHCLCSGKKCHKDHYAGICGCTCGECSGCDCKCILLAYIERIGDTKEWKVDHSVRRFIRPVLMRDPQLEKDKTASGGDPGIAQSIDTLSGEIPETEMKRVRNTLNALSESERALVIQILEAVPDRTEKAHLLHEIAIKHHDDKLGANVPRERRNLINRLKADLSEVRKRSQSSSKGKKTK